MDPVSFLAACSPLALAPTQQQIESLEAFEEALYFANQVMNLTRVAREECWLRHFVDSLLIAPLLPERARVLDIGPGPG
ncbi:MAG: class I SAM-dependent methyltransferase, partial [Fimbriimonas ginsengisoli]|nr:class I SAM-dependent methyltransferase [Fimbriimonas ginsengisoli]